MNIDIQPGLYVTAVIGPVTGTLAGGGVGGVSGAIIYRGHE